MMMMMMMMLLRRLWYNMAIIEPFDRIFIISPLVARATNWLHARVYIHAISANRNCKPDKFFFSLDTFLFLVFFYSQFNMFFRTFYWYNCDQHFSRRSVYRCTQIAAAEACVHGARTFLLGGPKMLCPVCTVLHSYFSNNKTVSVSFYISKYLIKTIIN